MAGILYLSLLLECTQRSSRGSEMIPKPSAEAERGCRSLHRGSTAEGFAEAETNFLSFSEEFGI